MTSTLVDMFLHTINELLLLFIMFDTDVLSILNSLAIQSVDFPFKLKLTTFASSSGDSFLLELPSPPTVQLYPFLDLNESYLDIQ